MRPSDRKRRSPWVIAIIVGFAIMIAANGAFIYIAVTGADPVVSSYVTERR